MAVLGVDAMAKGWVGVRLSDHGQLAVFSASTVTDLKLAAGTVDLVAIDIPIGLPMAGRRAADAEARSIIGARGSSVFSTPVRAALLAETFAEANLISQRLAGYGVTQQAFALRRKIFEVERWIASGAHTVREVHPEVSFAVLADAPLKAGKHTWTGVGERRALLRNAGIDLPDDLGPAGGVAGVDDVLDAAVGAWSAQRILAGNGRSLPSPPEVGSDGAELAIWV